MKIRVDVARRENTVFFVPEFCPAGKMTGCLHIDEEPYHCDHLGGHERRRGRNTVICKATKAQDGEMIIW